MDNYLNYIKSYVPILFNNQKIPKYVQNYINYIELKVPHLLLNDNQTEYNCSGSITSTNFSFLHKLVMETNKHKILEEYLKIYLQTEKGKKELNLQNTAGWTPLMLACRNFDIYSTFETVKILIEAKANLDLQNILGCTALMLVCIHSNKPGTLEIVKLFIVFGANLNLQEKKGLTPLMLACYNSLETAKLLIDAGAKLDLQDNRGRTALTFACYNAKTVESLETVILLIGATSNLRGQIDYTVLIYLLNNANTYDYIKYYIQNNENINKKNIEKYITQNKIPTRYYDLLVDTNIISPILPEIYKDSIHHIKIRMPLRILEKYESKISECMLCAENKKTLICNYDHHTCYNCLHKVNYKCQGCQIFL